MTSVADRRLQEHARDLLAHDDRVKHLDVEVASRGCVLHLTGDVPSHEDRRLVRSLLYRLRGVNAVWDLLHVGGRRPVIIDIGCGGVKQFDQSIGVDVAADGCADVLADIREGLPFATGSIDRVFAVHVLEHVLDPVALMAEIHRVLAPHGVLHALTPYWRHPNAVADPTHIRMFGPETFRGYCLRRPGITPFRPLVISSDDETVWADLEPAKDGALLPERELLAI